MIWRKFIKYSVIISLLTLILPTVVDAQDLEIAAPVGFGAFLTLVPLYSSLSIIVSKGRYDYCWFNRRNYCLFY